MTRRVLTAKAAIGWLPKGSARLLRVEPSPVEPHAVPESAPRLA